MSKLFIIGNGFDLQHKLKTSYKDFRDYLQTNNIKLEKEISDLFGEFDDVDELWNTFEKTLAIFNIDYFENQIDYSLISPADNSGEWRDSAWHDIQYQLDEEIQVFKKLKRYFIKWVNEIKIESSIHKNDISKEDYFISFNYTETLEKIYGIESDSVCHIHGKNGENLTIGHGKKYSDVFKNLKLDPNGNDSLYDPYNEDFRIDELRKIIASRTDQFHKPIEEIFIPKLARWLEHIPTPEEIIVIGHSYSKIDQAYFSYLKNRYPSVPWVYSVHDSQTEQNLIEMLTTINNLRKKED